MIFTDYQSMNGSKENRIQRIFGQKSLLLANLISILGLISWGIRLKSDTYIRWGYLASLGIVLLMVVINTTIWIEYQNPALQNRIKTLKSGQSLKPARTINL